MMRYIRMCIFYMIVSPEWCRRGGGVGRCKTDKLRIDILKL